MKLKMKEQKEVKEHKQLKKVKELKKQEKLKKDGAEETFKKPVKKGGEMPQAPLLVSDPVPKPDPVADPMPDVMAPDPTPETPAQVAASVFLMLDKDGSGKITAAELKASVKLVNPAVTDDDIACAMELFDKDRTGTITEKEFRDNFDKCSDKLCEAMCESSLQCPERRTSIKRHVVGTMHQITPTGSVSPTHRSLESPE